MPTTRLVLALALVAGLAAGCSRSAPEEQPNEGSSNGPNSAINQLNSTKAKMGEIDKKRREQNEAGAEGQQAP